MDLRVNFKDTEKKIACFPEQTVEDLKRVIRTEFLIPNNNNNNNNNFQLIFYGKVLKPIEYLKDTGLKNGSVVHIYQSSKISKISNGNQLIITGNGIPEFYVPANENMTVLELKDLVSARLGLQSGQLNLIFSGKILQDEMSLSFYQIFSTTYSNVKSRVYAVIKKKLFERKPRPSFLIDHLYQLVSSLISQPNPKRDVIMSEISELIDNPVLQSFARIDRDTQQLIDDALLILESIPSSSSSTSCEAVASLNDMTMTQYESSPEGMRALQEVMMAESEEYEDQGFMPTIVGGIHRISEGPLPVCWSLDNAATFSTSAFNCQPMGEVFARQIRALKKLGFKDESIILKALNETAGNMPKAAQILFGKNIHD